MGGQTPGQIHRMAKNVNETGGGQVFLVGISTWRVNPDGERVYDIFTPRTDSLPPFGGSAVGGEGRWDSHAYSGR